MQICTFYSQRCMQRGCSSSFEFQHGPWRFSQLQFILRILSRRLCGIMKTLCGIMEYPGFGHCAGLLFSSGKMGLMNKSSFFLWFRQWLNCISNTSCCICDYRKVQLQAADHNLFLMKVFSHISLYTTSVCVQIPARENQRKGKHW